MIMRSSRLDAAYGTTFSIAKLPLDSVSSASDVDQDVDQLWKQRWFRLDTDLIFAHSPHSPDSRPLESLLHQTLCDELGVTRGLTRMELKNPPTKIALQPRWPSHPLSQRDFVCFIKSVSATLDLTSVIEASPSALPMEYSLCAVVCKHGPHYCVFRSIDADTWQMWDCGYRDSVPIKGAWPAVREKLLGRSFVREKVLGTLSLSLLIYHTPAPAGASDVSASLSASRASRVSVLDEAIAAAQEESMRLRSAAGVLERLHAQLDDDTAENQDMEQAVMDYVQETQQNMTTSNKVAELEAQLVAEQQRADRVAAEGARECKRLSAELRHWQGEGLDELSPSQLIELLKTQEEAVAATRQMLNGKLQAWCSAQRLDQLEERQLCVVCSEQVRRQLFLPCRHLVTCATCSTQLKHCPMCRTEVESIVEAFM
jgi:hypothetical protein